MEALQSRPEPAGGMGAPPLTSADKFLRSTWYVAAWSRDVEAAPFARTILEQPIVMFRDSAGKIIALEDRCSHRLVPLSMGRVVGDTLQCGYHGLRFGCGGKCVEVPGQDRTPPRADIRSYPALERYGWVWLWMGAEPDADAELVPDCSWVDDGALSPVGSTKHLKANYTLLFENLLDSGHLPYVHQSTVGGTSTSKPAKLEVSRTNTGVTLDRWVENVPAPPTYLRTGRVDGNVDRWQHSEYVAPALVKQRVGGANTGTTEWKGQRNGGVELYLTHFMTPETDSSTFYFWSVGRDFDPDDEQVSAALFEDVSHAFGEDQTMLEAQQRANERFRQAATVNINADAAAFQSRRYLQRALDRQRGLAGVEAA